MPRMFSRTSDHDRGGHDGGGALRWLLTYADMITLLMAFFIMLYSMSVLNVSKFRQVAISIRSGFGGLLEGQGKYSLNATGQLSIRPSAIEGDTAGVPYSMIRQIGSFLKENRMEGDVKMYTDPRGLIINVMSDRILFKTGRADLRAEAVPLLKKIASVLQKIDNNIMVEGHTCDLPINTPEFPSNWELSTRRASNVVHYFIAKGGIAPERLSAAGYSDTHPIAPNTTSGNRASNRRVEIVIIRNEQAPAQAVPEVKTIRQAPSE